MRYWRLLDNISLNIVNSEYEIACSVQPIRSLTAHKVLFRKQELTGSQKSGSTENTHENMRV